MPLHHPHMGNHAFIGVKIGIKNQRLQRLIILALRGRNEFHHCIQYFLDALAGLGRGHDGVARVQADALLDFLLHPLRLCRGQVNLVDDRHDFQVMLQGHVDIGQGLGLNALGRIHY